MRTWVKRISIVAPLLLIAACGPPAASGQVEDPPRKANPDDPAGDQPARSPPFQISKETTYITGPLDADGWPDYVAALDRYYGQGVTPENNAAVPLALSFGPKIANYLECPPEYFRKLGVAPPPEKGDYFQSFDRWLIATGHVKEGDTEAEEIAWRHSLRAESQPWKRDEHPRVAAWLTAMKPHLDTAVAASHRSRMFVPNIATSKPDPEGDTSIPSIDQLGSLRISMLSFLNSGLQSRAMLRFGEGDKRGAWEDLAAVRRFAPLAVRQSPLHGLAIETDALEGVAHLALSGRLTADEARRMIVAVERWPSLDDALRAAQFDTRVIYLDALTTTARQGTEPLKKMMGFQFGVSKADRAKYDSGVDELVASGPIDWDAALRLVNDEHDKWDKCVRIASLRERLTAMEADDALDTHSRETLQMTAQQKRALSPAQRGQRLAQLCLAHPLVDENDPFNRGFSQSQSSLPEIARMRRNLLLAHLALAGYKADHGEYPAKLEAVSPKYLAKLPADPFGDGPLKYRREGKSYRLYSVGYNGRDDGGNPGGLDDEADDRFLPMPSGLEELIDEE